MGFATLNPSYKPFFFVGWVERSETHRRAGRGGAERLYHFLLGFVFSGVKNCSIRHTRESGYPVVRWLTGFPPSRE